ncbi:hypothetical protein HS088_TW05G00583 [Tripterygium wilfordii]|uniref:Uncharacterized protein n=1 Tax=Tripterygium wilfordii TaxID=458696 RepID=A0A7J7DNS6_TRIWF|nr:hypothetical protein HS088_TW05G00583 [Tripterygium wilfordii]
MAEEEEGSDHITNAALWLTVFVLSCTPTSPRRKGPDRLTTIASERVSPPSSTGGSDLLFQEMLPSKLWKTFKGSTT